jgi:hypothetical protein
MARLETVKVTAPDGYDRDFVVINKSDFDEDEHTLYEEPETDDDTDGVAPELSDAPKEEGPSDALVDRVGKRQAEALYLAGVGTVEDATQLDEEQLVALDGVGDATYKALHEG